MNHVEKAFGQVYRLHNTVYQRTNGWVGHRLLILPSLLLHTVGARTGKPRTTSLTYARDGDDYLVVASNGGAPRSPGWYHNLKANPNAEINVGPKRLAVTAQPVLPGDPDRERLWKIVTKYNKAYDIYQKRTSRPIPIVRLTPKA
ncbi:nitroreductase [Mycolicibacterium agri]|uniref:F420H(2)-dependent quinone reductase n=1 Tax=Mycolicibacterium agri TaxID=36811 RepID=A0A2A7MR94_MYCAG|nr:nitroreductase family deazaflavin-dependent oxidoreductase [Mycolicibacterium agri]PEG34204.1 nitroreductase [Mycolicibacterium agri]GFG54709.1 F420H(2)-dependent quinone reductase [Mycolicibacterium agri]